jgi:hypothetical protein
MLPLIHQHFVDHEDHVAALAAVLAADQRELSFVDTSSFQVMRRLNLRDAFTFDSHFARHGFVVAPAPQ